jgi:hypothetical protein
LYRASYATTARCADIPGPFLGNGSVNMSPFLGSRFLIMQQLDYNNGRGVFTMWSVPRYKEGTRLVLSSVWESVKRGLQPGSRGITIVGAVIRKRVVTD